MRGTCSETIVYKKENLIPKKWISIKFQTPVYCNEYKSDWNIMCKFIICLSCSSFMLMTMRIILLCCYVQILCVSYIMEFYDVYYSKSNTFNQLWSNFDLKENVCTHIQCLVAGIKFVDYWNVKRVIANDLYDWMQLLGIYVFRIVEKWMTFAKTSKKQKEFILSFFLW